MHALAMRASCPRSLDARSAIALDGAEFRRNAGVEDADPLFAQQREQLLGLLVGDDELDLDGGIGRQLEEVLLVQDTVAAEAGNRAKRRTAVNAQLLGLLEQPLEQGDVAMGPVFVDVEAQDGSSHELPQA